MRYYKVVSNGYVRSIGTGRAGIEITAEEYGEMLSVIKEQPTAPEGHAYRLTESLEWELYEVPVVEIDPDLTDAEALSILLGGETA